MAVVFDVRRLQRGLQLTKEEINGAWQPIAGVTWPRNEPLTCRWDNRTATRVRNLTVYMNNEHSFMAAAAGIPDVSDLVMIPSPDGRSVSINVGSAVKSEMDSQIARHGMGSSCAISAPPGSPPPPTPVENVLPPPAGLGIGVLPGDNVICLCVERLASGLVALDVMEPPWRGRGWDKEVMAGTTALWVAVLGYVPEVVGAYLGDAYINVRMKGASSHDEATRLFKPIQEAITLARADAGIAPPKDCCPREEVVGGGVRAPLAVVDEEAPIEELQVVEAGMGLGTWIAIGAGVGVSWMFWKVMFGKRR